ncbi:MAG: hypothetical protein HYV27_08065 [Candidatus Hydrogenedentes bacterium]|nr:hypothetical protein [Candidatus Hydrogenedentota bacterium]
MNRYVIRFQLRLDAPMHIGTGVPSPATDMPVHRDSFGYYRIPGTSLAGILRSILEDRDVEPETVDHIMGCVGTKEQDDGKGSRLSISDGYLVDYDGQPAIEKHLAGETVYYPMLSAIIDRNRLDPETGTVEKGGKFDLEIYPEGTFFAFELVYYSFQANGADGPEKVDHIDIVKRLLYDLGSGDTQIGGFTTSGLGFVSVLNPTFHAFDMTNAGCFRQWLSRPHRLGDPVDAGIPTEEPATKGLPMRECEANTLHGSVTIGFKADGPLRIGGAQGIRISKEDAVDLTFCEVPVVDMESKQVSYQPWVAGSGLKGVLKHRCRQIASALSLDGDTVLDELFGPDLSRRPGNGDTRKRLKGRVTLRGCTLQDQEYTTVQHVAIDRLTGGALRGALYSERPIWSENLTFDIPIHLCKLPLGAAGLLAHAVLDLGEGRLPIGGGSRRGNGRLLFAASEDGPGGMRVAYNLHWRGIQLKDTIQDLDALNNLVAEASAALEALPTINENVA